MIETEHNNKAIGFVSTSFQVVLNLVKWIAM